MINRAYVIGFLLYVSALIYLRTLFDTNGWVIILIILSFVVSTINLLIVFGFWKGRKYGDKELNKIFIALFGFIGLYTGGQALMMFLNRHEYYNIEKLKYQDIGYAVLAFIFVWLLKWIYKRRK